MPLLFRFCDAKLSTGGPGDEPPRGSSREDSGNEGILRLGELPRIGRCAKVRQMASFHIIRFDMPLRWQ